MKACAYSSGFLPFDRHVRGFNDQRLARAHVAGLAAVHNVGIGDVDLLNLGIVVGGLLDQPVNLVRRKLNRVVGEIFRNFIPGFADRLENVAQLRAELRAVCL